MSDFYFRQSVAEREVAMYVGLTRFGGWRSLIVVLVVAVIAVACGDDETGGASGDEAGGSADYEIAVVTGSKSDPFHQALGCGARAAAEELGVQINLQAPQEPTPTQQIPMINAALAQDPDALVVAPTDAAALVPPLERAKQDGVVISLIDTGIEKEGEIAVSAVTEDYLKGGEEAAHRIADLVGGEGKVMLISYSPGVTTQDDGEAGFEKGVQAVPGLEYLGTQYDKFDIQRTASIVSATLAKHPDLAGIVTLNGYSSPGIIDALKRAGRLGEVKYISFDATPDEVRQLKAGEIDQLLFWKPFEIGEAGVRNAVAALNGEEVEQKVYTQPELATQENIDNPEIQKYLYHGC